MADTKKPGWMPKRYVLSFMIFFGFFIMYGLRVNLNVAIGAMAKNHTIFVNGKATKEPPEFQWSSRLQGVVLGSFYYGYIALQILGGYLALRIGATRLYGVSLFTASLLTLLTPVATRASVHLLIILRIIEGLVLGVMFPCNHAIWSKWAPSMERATLLTLSIAGCTTGSVASMPISALLTMTGIDGGWPLAFYFFGALGVLWYGLWFFLIYETPSEHPTISIKERELIEETAVSAAEIKGKVPWRQLLTSRRVWAITAAAFAGDWGLYVLLICIPLYLLDVMNFDLHKMGFAAAMPFLFKAISCPLGGTLSDCLLRRGWLSVLATRRLFFSLGATASIYILLSGYTEDRYLVVGWIALAGFASGFVYSGFHVNMLDIAPRNASIIMGLCNTVGGTTGFITPMMVGFLTRNKTAAEWRTVFWVTLLIYLFGAIIFCTCITDQRQEWDKTITADTRPNSSASREEIKLGDEDDEKKDKQNALADS